MKLVNNDTDIASFANKVAGLQSVCHSFKSLGANNAKEYGVVFALTLVNIVKDREGMANCILRQIIRNLGVLGSPPAKSVSVFNSTKDVVGIFGRSGVIGDIDKQAIKYLYSDWRQ